MFTGIVECIAEIRSVERKHDLMEMSIDVPEDISDSRVGDSFCVQGACLTAVEVSSHGLRVDVSLETLSRTTLGSFILGRRVNLERALRLADRLGGHLVSGHVDGVGRVTHIRKDGKAVSLRIQADAKVSRYLIEKGSICVDGVSLTLGACEEDSFWIHLIPHTLKSTTLQYLRAGDRVNLEADLIGKYVEKLLAGKHTSGGGGKGVSRDFLAQHGF